MITITPEMTAEQLRSLSENLKRTIIDMAFDIEQITDALQAKNDAHTVEVENLKAKHEAELTRLIESHEDMAETVESNRAFISAISQFINQ